MSYAGPWRISLSQEGKDSNLWSDYYTNKYLENGYAEWDGVKKTLLWNPRYMFTSASRIKWKGNPSGTIIRNIPRQSLVKGCKIKLQMRSKKVEIDDVDYTDTWSPREMQNNLRRVAGTGDFRIGLMQTDGPDTGKWHAYQVRVYPYLHEDAKTHIGDSDTSNCSYWYRDEPGPENTLVDDWSQETHRFKKLKHKGDSKFGMGPHAPYNEWFDIEVELKKDVDDNMSSSIRVHKDKVVLDDYKHVTTGFSKPFEHIDAICLSYNNMRPYFDIQLKMDEPSVTYTAICPLCGK